MVIRHVITKKPVLVAQLVEVTFGEEQKLFRILMLLTQQILMSELKPC